MKFLRRIFIAIAGGTVLLIGIVMIVLPGPATLVIPAGLAILALEFAWAKHILHQMREFIAAKTKKSPTREAPVKPAYQMPSAAAPRPGDHSD